jgi:flagellar hook-basal body complex protein FliE
MTMDLKSIPPGLLSPRPIGSDTGVQPPLSTDGTGGPNFADALKNAVADANTKVHSADQAVESFMLGEGSVHKAMIAMQDAQVAMEMVVAVRNKALEAYQEIMRMPV